MKPWLASAVALLVVAASPTVRGDDAPETAARWHPLPGEVFEVAGRPAFLVRPAKAAAGNPWLIYAPTFHGSLPAEKDEGWMFGRFLAAGIAIAGVDVGESFGSSTGRAAFTALYDKLTRDPGLSTKVCLLGRSRGGLMVYSWAADHPDKVACIAGIYPVLDLTTYPGLAKACGAYGLNESQFAAQLQQHNPVERLAPLARAGVPIFQIHGDKDVVVPYEQNAAEPARRYQTHGGKMRLVLAKDQGHNYWPGFFQCQELVDFVIQKASVRATDTGGASRDTAPAGSHHD